MTAIMPPPALSGGSGAPWPGWATDAIPRRRAIDARPYRGLPGRGRMTMPSSGVSSGGRPMPDGTRSGPAVRAYVEALSAEERARIGEDVLAAVRADGYVPANPFDAVDAGIRRTLAVSRVDVPAGTRIGE